MAKSKRHTNLESLTLFQILTSLKPAQAWTMVVLIFGLLSGTFGLGYNLKSSIAESETAKYQNELTTLQTSVKQFRGLQTKEKFLALYLRYLFASTARDRSESEENKKALAEAGTNLKSYINELLERGEEAKDEIDLRGIFLGKGGMADATVKFGYDGSIWPVPPEFGIAELK